MGGGAGHEIGGGAACAGVLSAQLDRSPRDEGEREDSEQNDEAQQTKRYSLPLVRRTDGRHAAASGVGRAFRGRKAAIIPRGSVRN